MTPTEINSAVAEETGWKNLHVNEEDPTLSVLCGDPPEALAERRRHLRPGGRVPDYCSDLNEMHTVELSHCWGPTLLERYSLALAKEVGGRKYLFLASAQQRARAFLYTRGRLK